MLIAYSSVLQIGMLASKTNWLPDTCLSRKNAECNRLTLRKDRIIHPCLFKSLFTRWRRLSLTFALHSRPCLGIPSSVTVYTHYRSDFPDAFALIFKWTACQTSSPTIFAYLTPQRAPIISYNGHRLKPITLNVFALTPCSSTSSNWSCLTI